MLIITGELPYSQLLPNFCLPLYLKDCMPGVSYIILFQFGFQSNHSTTDAIFVLNSLIEYTKIKHQKLYCCFVDFRKAFDSVHHQLLWHKLSSIGVSTKLLKLLIDIEMQNLASSYVESILIVSSVILESDKGVLSVQSCLHFSQVTY